MGTLGREVKVRGGMNGLRAWVHLGREVKVRGGMNGLRAWVHWGGRSRYVVVGMACGHGYLEKGRSRCVVVNIASGTFQREIFDSTLTNA